MAKTFRQQRSEEKPKDKYKRAHNSSKDLMGFEDNELSGDQDHDFNESEEYNGE